MIRLLALLLLAGCAAMVPTPAKPDPYCHPEMMLRAMDHSVYGVSSCFACVGATGCATEGGEWCCKDSMCFECTPSPVPFDDRRKDSAILHR